MIIKNLLAHKSIWLISAIFWTFIILFLCLINSDDLPSLNLQVKGTDKVFHFILHFMFTSLWTLYLYAGAKTITKSKIVKIILSSFLFGVLIEFIQEYYTTSRNGDVFDVLSNTLGAFTAGILLYFILNRIKKLKT